MSDWGGPRSKSVGQATLSTNNHVGPETELASYDAQSELKRLEDPNLYRKRGIDIALEDSYRSDKKSMLRESVEREIIEKYKHVFNELKRSNKLRLDETNRQRKILYNELVYLAGFGEYTKPRHRRVDDPTDLEETIARTRARINESNSDFRNELKMKRQAELASLDELNSFRAKNFIELSARSPKQSEHVLTDLATIVFLGLFEVFVNFLYFLGLGDIGGLGAFFEMFLFVPLNVGLASLVGFVGLRYAIHVEIRKRVAAWVLTTTLVTVLTFLILYMAAVRLSLNPETSYTTSQTLEILLSKDLLQILGLNDLLVSVLDILIAFLVAWKAYSIFDRYPGFTRVYSGYQANVNARKMLEITYRENLEIIRSEGVRALNDIYLSAVSNARLFRSLLELSKSDVVEAERSRVDIIRACQGAINIFTIAYMSAISSDETRTTMVDEGEFQLEYPDLSLIEGQADEIDQEVLAKISDFIDHHVEQLASTIDHEFENADLSYGLFEDEVG